MQNSYLMTHFWVRKISDDFAYFLHKSQPSSLCYLTNLFLYLQTNAPVTAYSSVVTANASWLPKDATATSIVMTAAMSAIVSPVSLNCLYKANKPKLLNR